MNRTAFGASPGLATAAVARPGTGALTGVYATNENAIRRYLLLFDSASVPQAGDVPQIAFDLPPASSGSSGQLFLERDFLGAEGMGGFARGIAYAVSTTKSSYTPATAGEHSVVITHV